MLASTAAKLSRHVVDERRLVRFMLIDMGDCASSCWGCVVNAADARLVYEKEQYVFTSQSAFTYLILTVPHVFLNVVYVALTTFVVCFFFVA